MNSAAEEIERLLRERQPASLLLLTPDSRWHSLCEPYCQRLLTPKIPDADGTSLDGIGHVDMALVIGLIEQLDKRDAVAMLGRLRNVHTDLLYVLAGGDPRWTLTDWLALALQRAGEFSNDDGRQLTLYRYDLGSYNRARSWNNPKYWANPENWGRFRW